MRFAVGDFGACCEWAGILPQVVKKPHAYAPAAAAVAAAAVGSHVSRPKQTLASRRVLGPSDTGTCTCTFHSMLLLLASRPLGFYF